VSSRRASLIILAVLFVFSAAAGPAAADSTIKSVAFDRGDDPTLATVPIEPLLFYIPDNSETARVVLTQTATDLVITAPSAINLQVPPPCAADGPTVARCPLAQLPARWFGVLGTARPLTLETASDVTINILGNGLAPGSVLSGGAGADVLTAGIQGVVDGGAGNDHLSSIGTGRLATLRGGPGDDQILDAADAQGGAGNDTIENALSADGGPGSDTIAGGGAGANLHGGDGDDSLTECAACPGQGGVLAGDDGEDAIHGSGQGATLDGGADADVIEVDRSGTNPPLVANPVKAGTGNDKINAKDALTQAIDCGAGTDTVSHDRPDTLSGCENDLDPAPADGGGGTGGGGSSPQTAAQKQADKLRAVTIVGSIARLRAASNGTVRFSLACPSKLICAVSVLVKRGKAKVVTKSLKFRGTKAVTLRLNRATLALLRRKGSLKVSVRFTAAKSSGTRKVPAARTITLLAPKKAKAKAKR
jgi:hypothetical protein